MRAATILAVAFAFVWAAGASYAQDLHAPAGVKDMHGMLVDAHGMTLYTFDKDMNGKSMCTGRCANAWPALDAAADAKNMGPWTVITRADGSKQWAYKGMPLYTFARDKAAGDATGDGRGNGAWHIAKP